MSLLSSVYDRLQARIEESSPKIIVALMAFILTVSSQPHLNRICECVGMRSSQSSGNPRRTPGYQFRVLQDGIEVPNLEDEASDDDDEDDSHPSFLSPSLVQGLMRARRSLKLLRAAQPEHALVRSTPDEAILRWIWTESDITEVFETGALKASPSSVHEEEPPRITPYGVDFPEFQLFDCEPGSQVASDVIVSESSQPSQFELFLAPFPDSLPSLTPTLPALADLVLSPLVQRLSSISTALVDVFLSPDTHLHLYSNLVLLRSYLLLTSPSFKSRLQAALFSDADECLTPLPPTKSQKSSGKATSHSAPSRHAPSPINRWAVGLSRKLMEGGWPPGGANLSFSLRTVIIDSLENDNYHKFRKAREAPEEFDHERLRILREAEWRLGFAIRDLPIGSEARWLNPRCTCYDVTSHIV